MREERVQPSIEHLGQIKEGIYLLAEVAGKQDGWLSHTFYVFIPPVVANGCGCGGVLSHANRESSTLVVQIPISENTPTALTESTSTQFNHYHHSYLQSWYIVVSRFGDLEYRYIWYNLCRNQNKPHTMIRFYNSHSANQEIQKKWLFTVLSIAIQYMSVTW